MPRRYLLDTNILSELIRTPDTLQKRIAAVDQSQLCTSIVNACELRFGATKKGSATLSRRVDELLRALTVLPLRPDADHVYADIRNRLESKGLTIGSNDFLIAAHAISERCILVTGNQKEFRRVPGLDTENWLSGRRRSIS